VSFSRSQAHQIQHRASATPDDEKRAVVSVNIPLSSVAAMREAADRQRHRHGNSAEISQ
jgi:hypothetical protein